MEVACAAPTVICCRCTPAQKAEVVRLIRNHTRLITAAIGDGGNDVAMIQAGTAALPWTHPHTPHAHTHTRTHSLTHTNTHTRARARARAHTHRVHPKVPSVPSHGGVAMAQAAHVGIGIEGSEGRHAALAADFSIRQAATLCSRGCNPMQ